MEWKDELWLARVTDEEWTGVDPPPSTYGRPTAVRWRMECPRGRGYWQVRFGDRWIGLHGRDHARNETLERLAGAVPWMP